MTQPMGVLHGGISVVLAENVASMGGYFNIDAGTLAMYYNASERGATCFVSGQYLQ